MTKKTQPLAVRMNSGEQVSIEEIDEMAHVMIHRNGASETERGMGHAMLLLVDEIRRLSDAAGHTCPPGQVYRKFDGGRVALLCPECRQIVGYDRYDRPRPS